MIKRVVLAVCMAALLCGCSSDGDSGQKYNEGFTVGMENETGATISYSDTKSEYTVSKDTVVRNQAKAEGEAIGTIVSGTSVTIIGSADSNGYVMVNYNGRAGYIRIENSGEPETDSQQESTGREEETEERTQAPTQATRPTQSARPTQPATEEDTEDDTGESTEADTEEDTEESTEADTEEPTEPESEESTEADTEGDTQESTEQESEENTESESEGESESSSHGEPEA